MRRVLVVDDEENIRLVLRTLLRKHGYEVEVAESGEDALAQIDTFGPDVILTDVRMPKMGGLDLLATLKAKQCAATVIVMSAYGSNDLALEAMKAGAYDYVSKPFKPDEIVLALRKAEERESLRRENRALREQIRHENQFESILAKSPQMVDVFRTIQKVADFKTTVLVMGESGVGKELVARAIHATGVRRSSPFVAINCGAIPENLLESELFGHKKGSFTDASSDRRGLFEEASGGTLLLDEIGELPLNLQVKLLRALQEESIRRVGDSKDIKVDVRIIAATHRDLNAEAKAGRFREDLFYRINVLPIPIPPLRARREDINLLIDHFLARNNARLGSAIRGLTQEARKLLLDYAWPGNVRELENTIERAMVLADADILQTTDLPERIREALDPVQMQLATGELSIKKTSAAIEEILIRRALAKTSGNRTRAAEVLEISHRALLYKIKDYKISDLRGGAPRLRHHPHEDGLVRLLRPVYELEVRVGEELLVDDEIGRLRLAAEVVRLPLAEVGERRISEGAVPPAVDRDPADVRRDLHRSRGAIGVEEDDVAAEGLAEDGVDPRVERAVVGDDGIRGGALVDDLGRALRRREERARRAQAVVHGEREAERRALVEERRVPGIDDEDAARGEGDERRWRAVAPRPCAAARRARLRTNGAAVQRKTMTGSPRT